MQFIDLSRQYDALRPAIDANIHRVLSRCSFVGGPEIDELEEALASYSGAKHALAVSSGTDALLMPLIAWGIGPGDAVFTTPFSFFATAEVIALVGATPVFADIDPITFTIDPSRLRAAIEGTLAEGLLTPRAVIPVDLFGQCADYDAIVGIAEEYGLLVLEDAAQGFGATYRGRRAGTFGNAAATSFFPAKPLGCFGDGGAVFTDDDTLAAALRSIRVHGQGEDKYENVRIGINGRLDTLQAAVLLPKLAAFDGEIARRNEVAARYSARLAGSVRTPTVSAGSTSVWAQYSLLADRTDQRDQILESLRDAGIPAMIYYARPLHRQKAFEYLGYHEGAFPTAEEVSRRIFSLPMHAYIEDSEVDAVCDAVLSAFRGGSL